MPRGSACRAAHTAGSTWLRNLCFGARESETLEAAGDEAEDAQTVEDLLR